MGFWNLVHKQYCKIIKLQSARSFDDEYNGFHVGNERERDVKLPFKFSLTLSPSLFLVSVIFSILAIGVINRAEQSTRKIAFACLIEE